MDVVQFKQWYAEKKKNKYRNHFKEMEDSTPGKVITCGPFTVKESRKVKVSGKSTFNQKANKAAYNRIWRYYDVKIS